MASRPSPPAIQPPASFLNESRESEVLAAGIVLLILPTLAVGLRLWSRRIARAGFWWDDYTIMVSMVFDDMPDRKAAVNVFKILSWGPAIAMLDSRDRGLGKHLYAIDHPPGDTYYPLKQFFKNLYAFQLLYAIAITSTRVSIILFMHRIFPIVHFRRFLIGCHVYNAALGFAAVLTELMACVPAHDFWDKFGGTQGGSCINLLHYFIAAGSINAATNFILLATPIPLLTRLRTTILQKVVIAIFFIIGLTVCAVGITHVVTVSNVHEDDLTWNYVDAAIWTTAEPSIAVVSACIPSLRPLFARLIWGREYRPKHLPRSSQHSLSRSWLGWNKEAERSPSGNFNKLRESGGSDHGMGKPWMHNVAVSGGMRDLSNEEYMMGSGGRASHYHVPDDGIRVRTTITVTERVDWREDLF